MAMLTILGLGIESSNAYYTLDTTLRIYPQNQSTGYITGTVVSETGLIVNQSSDYGIMSWNLGGTEDRVNIRFNTSLPMYANISYTDSTLGSGTSIDYCQGIQQNPSDDCSGQGECLAILSQGWGLASSPLNQTDFQKINPNTGTYSYLYDVDISSISIVYGVPNCFRDDFPNTQANSGTSPYLTDYGWLWNRDLSMRPSNDVSWIFTTARSGQYANYTYADMSFKNLTGITNQYTAQPSNNSVVQKTQSSNTSFPVTFNATIKSNGTITNVSLWTNQTGWSINQTIFPTDSYGGLFSFNMTYYPENYTMIWTIIGCDSNGKCTMPNLGTGRLANRTIRFNRTSVAPPPSPPITSSCSLPSLLQIGIPNQTELPYILMENCPSNNILSTNYITPYIFMNSTGVLELKPI